MKNKLIVILIIAFVAGLNFNHIKVNAAPWNYVHGGAYYSGEDSYRFAFDGELLRPAPEDNPDLATTPADYVIVIAYNNIDAAPNVVIDENQKEIEITESTYTDIVEMNTFTKSQLDDWDGYLYLRCKAEHVDFYFIGYESGNMIYMQGQQHKFVNGGAPSMSDGTYEGACLSTSPGKNDIEITEPDIDGDGIPDSEDPFPNDHSKPNGDNGDGSEGDGNGNGNGNGDGNGSESDGSGSGDGSNSCDGGCSVLDCPGWDDFMGKLDEITGAIPPPPNWDKIMGDFGDMISEATDSINSGISDATGSINSSIGDASDSINQNVNNAVGTAPNIPNLPGDVTLDKGNLETPTGQKVPGFDDSSFSKGDIESQAPDIEVREDPTGGFDITDPIGSLPSQEEFKDNIPDEGDMIAPEVPEVDAEAPEVPEVDAEVPKAPELDAEVPTVPDENVEFPSAPKEPDNVAPTPGEVGGTAPTPDDNGATAPLPNEGDNVAPTPDDSGGNYPIPDDYEGNAPMPNVDNSTAPIP